MAKKSKKKKKQQKHHHFVSPTTSEQTAGMAGISQPATAERQQPDTATEAISGEAVVSPASQSKKTPVDESSALKTRLMLADARNTALIGGSIIVALFILWYLFEHTGLGMTVYHILKV